MRPLSVEWLISLLLIWPQCSRYYFNVHSALLESGVPYHLQNYVEVLVINEVDVRPNNEYLGNPFTVLAVQNMSNLITQSEFNMICNRASTRIFIFPRDISSFAHSMVEISKGLNCGSKITRAARSYWMPRVFLYYPRTVMSSRADVGQQIIEIYNSSSLMQGNTFPVNSQFYIVVENFKTNESGDVARTIVFELFSISDINLLREIIIQSSHRIEFDELCGAVEHGRLSRRQNFMGATIRAVAQEDFEESVSFVEVDGVTQFTGGFEPEYFDVMAKSLNISTIPVRGTGWIGEAPNGSLTGMGHQLMSGQADISITHSEFLESRGRELAFLHPHYASRIMTYFRQPSTKSIRDIYFQSLRAFGYAFPCSWVLVLASLFLISWVVQFMKSQYNCNNDTFGNVIQWVIGSFCLQGSTIQPTSIHMRAGVLISLLLGAFMHMVLTVSIVSQLSIPDTPIKTFDDILKSGMTIYRDNVTLSISGFLIQALGNEDTKILNAVLERTINGDIAVEKIKKDSIAYLSQPDEFYSRVRSEYTDTSFCEIVSEVLADPISVPVLQGMMMAKGSPYKEIFSFKQLQMRETGIHERLVKRYSDLVVAKCSRSLAKSTFFLGLKDTAVAFVFLILSFLVCVLSLCAEHLLKHANMNGYSVNRWYLALLYRGRYSN